MACCSTAGFHQGSIRKIWFAVVRSRPTPQAFRLSRSTYVFPDLNPLSAVALWLRLIEPSTRCNRTPSYFSPCSTKSSIDVHCENTIDFSSHGRFSSSHEIFADGTHRYSTSTLNLFSRGMVLISLWYTGRRHSGQHPFTSIYTMIHARHM
jgi:hypothetical protein